MAQEFLTKYELVADGMAERIRSGELQPGDPLPSIRSLMESLGLGMSTVTRGLRTLEDRGLVRRHPHRGYFVNGETRAAGDGQTRQIALLTPVLRETTAVYARGVAKSLGEDGRFVIGVFGGHHDAEAYRDALRHLLEAPPAGMILFPPPVGTCRREMSALGDSEIPCVFIGRGPDDGALMCDRVLKWVRVGTERLMGHLLSRGCREFQLLLSTPPADFVSVEFRESVREHIAKGAATLTAEHVLASGTLPHPGGYRAEDLIKAHGRFISDLMDEGERFRNVICSEDYAAFGLIVAAREHGLQIPRDITVASGIRGASRPLGFPQLTAIDFHKELTGRLAGEILARRLEGYDGPPQIHHIGGDLVMGETV